MSISASSSKSSVAHERRVQLSQNFLKDPRLVASLVDAFRCDADTPIFDIGAGAGIITEALARRYRRVIAIEADPTLAQRLQQRFGACPNVTVHTGDFLQYQLPTEPYSVFSNIPFNITTAIVGKLTSVRPPQQQPTVAYLMMQQEAARMYQGWPHESLRTLLLKPWFDVEIVHRFRRSDFAPAPRVDVVMLRLRKRGPPLVPARDRQLYRDFVVHLFTYWQPHAPHPLRQLITHSQFRNLEHALGRVLGPTPTALTLEQWLHVFGIVQALDGGRILQSLSGSERRLLRQQQRLQKQHRTRTHGDTHRRKM